MESVEVKKICSLPSAVNYIWEMVGEVYGDFSSLSVLCLQGT